MFLFWRRKRSIAEEHKHDREANTEVVELNKKIHAETDEAKKRIDRLNRMLKADGITLKIYNATSGGKHD